MTCSQVQDAILDALHDPPAVGGACESVADRLPTPQREHLATCASCQAFVAAQLRWDDQFTAALQVAPLSDAFTTELWRQVDALPAVLPPEELTRKRQLIESEYAAALKAMRSTIWRDLSRRGPPALLATLAFALAVLFGYFAWGHSAMVRDDFGDWLGTALLLSAAAIVVSTVIATATWLTRFAVRTPVIDET